MNNRRNTRELEAAQRLELLERFPPAWPDIYAHHVTLGVNGLAGKPGAEMGLIVGIALGDGIEALVVEIDGTTFRPDGKIYHVTWSLDRARGRRPVDSNALLQGSSWIRIDPPIPIKLTVPE
jgi:hypothetical protein